MVRRALINFLSAVLYYSGLIGLLRRWGRNYPKILLYHSVSETESAFIKGTHVWMRPSRFQQHLSYIRRRYRILSLESALRALQEGRVPARSVVITFDDGFADNFSEAYPHMKRHGIPATIFLVTDAVDNRNLIWIQKLYYLMNTLGVVRVAESLAACSAEPGMKDVTARYEGHRDLPRRLEKYMTYSMDRSERNRVLARVCEELKVSAEAILATHPIYLNWDQIREMYANGIAFGNHGRTHTAFSTLSLDEQQEEMTTSQRALEANLHQDFLPFGYPFGQTRDFTSATKELAQKTGHACTLTAMPTLNSAETSVFELGRIQVNDVPTYRLAFELEKGMLKDWLMRTRLLTSLLTRDKAGTDATR